jgi:hypothetical protein
MIDRHRAERHQGHDRRQAGFFGKRHGRSGSTRMHDAAAEVENRPGGGVDHRCRRLDQFG